MKKPLLLILCIAALALSSKAQSYVPWENEVIIAQETFGTKEYGTNNPTPSLSGGWGSGTAWHYNWYDVTTFTTTNGYFETGSDSSIRIVSYNSSAKPAEWPTPSGSMHLLLTPPAGYSGSWDTICFKGINIAGKMVSTVEFGWAKRGNMGPADSLRGLSVEIRIDGGQWVQLDTVKMQNPLAGDKWSYAILPINKLRGSQMEIRFACYKNQIELDDITVKGAVYNEMIISQESFGTKEYGTNNTTPSLSGGWGSGSAWHYNWYDVTTFTTTNGYFETGSDSSIRIVSYNSSTKPAEWPTPSGSMHLLLTPPTGYSGSWDTVCFKGINIAGKMVSTIEFGWAKRGNMGPVDSIRGLSVEIKIDGGAWIQLDTVKMQNPLAGDKWSYAILPINKLRGSQMEIRFACYKNQIELDDITVKGLEYIESTIASETFGTKEYGTNNPTPSLSGGWGSGTAWHYNWYDVTTFTTTNGYFETGSDSSIRIVSYNSSTKPAEWPTPSGSMHLLLTPPTGYSGSWDTVSFKGINIKNQIVTSIEFGWAKRGNMGPVDSIRGLSVEIRTDGGQWMQLDTVKMQNPLAGDKWSYAVFPVSGVEGSKMEIRFACYKNQIEIDDILVNGAAPTPKGENDFAVSKVVVGAVDSDTDYKCDLNFKWDADNAYLKFVIADDSLVADGTVYQVDNIEVYFDMDNSKNIHWPRNGGWVSADPTYDANDYQLRLVPQDEFSANNPNIKGATQIYTKTDIGYNFELTIPWDSLMAGFEPALGVQIGFDVLVSDNDAVASDANRNQITLVSTTDKPFNDPSLFGTFQFEGMGTFSVISDTIAPGKATALTATPGKEAVTLAWENATDNIAILYYNVYQGETLLPSKVYPKETGNTLKVSKLAGGSYSFSLEAVDNFGNVSKEKATVSATVVSKNDLASGKIMVYPNPAVNELYIKGVENISHVEIIGVAGNVVKVHNGSSVINVADLAKGAYLIKVHTENEISTSRFIKN